ncbi:MAG: polyribonucleotide nucleotidyltransferase, partial [Candidatus Aminicenantes bacterium]|nr:polyribonucleotide nucleotidyltransferase [Candidatus Aminicenantes bacterium]
KRQIEAGAIEVEEEKIVEALEFAREPIKEIIYRQKELFSSLNIKKRDFTPLTLNEDKLRELEDKLGGQLLEAMQGKTKKERETQVDALLKKLLEPIPAENEAEIEEIKNLFYELQRRLVRRMILEEGKRIDGRNFDDIRPISIEVGLLPRTHGSALFTRGETQCLATVTLGTFEDVQILDGIGEEAEKRFMLHYNFPPFSVGEVAFLRAPGRREIGHGALAERAILPAIPDEDTFPYTIRIVSDILESNGSSSMATVCGGILSLMDAGVPLTMMVAGIAIGLVKESERYILLTDIAGYEDHFGDMDFKVAGTEKGITAIQMDLKIPSISTQIIREALTKAKQARILVLEKMREILPAPRPDLSPYAPRIITLFINPEKVSEVIGPAGKVIKKIIAATNTKIDIEETGKITIAAPNMEGAEKAKQMIREITVEAEVGKVYTGKIVRLEDYGAFVEILPNIVGLLHISEVAHHRIRNIRDIFKVGQTITVKVLSIDEDHKIRLSKKALETPPSPPSGTKPWGQKEAKRRGFYQQPFKNLRKY